MPFTTYLKGTATNNSTAKILLSIGLCLAKASLVDIEILKRHMHKGDDVTLREFAYEDKFSNFFRSLVLKVDEKMVAKFTKICRSNGRLIILQIIIF